MMTPSEAQLDEVHGEILEVLEMAPPQSWSLGEASFILDSLRGLAAGRNTGGNVVSMQYGTGDRGPRLVRS